MPDVSLRRAFYWGLQFPSYQFHMASAISCNALTALRRSPSCILPAACETVSWHVCTGSLEEDSGVWLGTINAISPVASPLSAPPLCAPSIMKAVAVAVAVADSAGDKKGHICPPSNAAHPRDRWESLFVYSFICKFTNMRGKVDGLNTPMECVRVPAAGAGIRSLRCAQF